MLLVAIGLFLRALIYLVDMIVDYYAPNISSRINLDWATSFIYNIMTIGIWLGVTAVAVIGSYLDSMPKDDPPTELAPFAQPYVYE